MICKQINSRTVPVIQMIKQSLYNSHGIDVQLRQLEIGKVHLNRAFKIQ